MMKSLKVRTSFPTYAASGDTDFARNSPTLGDAGFAGTAAPVGAQVALCEIKSAGFERTAPGAVDKPLARPYLCRSQVNGDNAFFAAF